MLNPSWRMRTGAVAAVALILAFAPPLTAQRRAASATPASTIDPGMYGTLRYRFIGPPGNRVSSVAGVAGDPMVYYAGAASGGI